MECGARIAGQTHMMHCPVMNQLISPFRLSKPMVYERFETIYSIKILFKLQYLKTRHTFFFLFACCFWFLTLFSNLKAQNKPRILKIPLNSDSQISIEGSYRFVKIAGITGLHVSSLKTK